MLRILLLPCLLLASAALAQDGPVASWSFDEGRGDTVADGSGEGNTGKVHGPAFVKRGEGYALRFDGKDDWVDCGAGASLNLTDTVTLEAWVRPLGLPAAEPMILGKYFDSYGLTQYKDGNAWFYISGGGNNLRARLPIGEWSYVVATFDGTRMSLYVGRECVATKQSLQPKIAPGKHFIMGALMADPAATDPGYSGTTFWQGELDDVRVYHRVLTADEVVQRYKQMAASYGVDTTWWDKLRLTLYTYPDEPKLAVVADLEGIFPRPDDAVLTLGLRDPQGQPVPGQSQQFPKLTRQRVVCASFDLAGLQPGRYTVAGDVSAPSGLKVARAAEFAHPAVAPPLPAPAQRTVGKLPTPPPALKFTARPQPDGSILLQAAGRTLTIGASFSYPHGGDNAFGPAAQAEPGWRTTVRTLGQDRFAITGTGKHYTITRSVTVYPNRLAIQDTVRNTGAEDVGIIVDSYAACPGAPYRDRWLAGFPGGTELAQPNSPSSFVNWDNMGLGVLPLDDVSVLQSTVYVHDERLGFRNDKFGLAAGAQRVLEWAVYPQTSPDYYDFINQVRRDEGRYQTVAGGFAFVPRQQFSREYAAMRNTLYASFGCLTHVADDPEIEIEGIDFLWLPQERARIRREFDDIRQTNPQLKLMFHIAHSLVSTNKPETLFADSRVLDQSGKQVLYPYNYDACAYFSRRRHEEGWRWYIYYPTPGNSFHDALMKSVDVMVDDITCDGAFMDGFFYGYGSPWTYDRWDGATVQIDPQTKLIQRKYASVLLLSQPSMVQYVQRMAKRNAVVIANGTTITRTIGKLPIIVDQECLSGPNVHLAQTPCALGNPSTIHDETDVYADALDKLRWGNLYFYYGEGTLTHPSLPQQQFPITVEQLHAGVITGRERVITMKPGVYGWPGGRDLHMTYRYSKVGLPIPPGFLTTVDRAGVRTQVDLEPDESAVIKHIPVELQCPAPANVRVTRYDSEDIALQVSGQGRATLVVRTGEFGLAAGQAVTVTVGTATTQAKADRGGVVRVPLTLSGAVRVTVAPVRPAP
jgi:hypothetical protein